MFRPFAEWLSNTAFSVWIQDHSWIVPISQSIHIVGVCLVFTSALTINARLLGFRKSGRSISELVTTLLPVMWWSLAGLLFTGLLQTITEPVRQFVTPMYWAKLLSIVVVVLMTAAFARRVRANATRWDDAGQRPGGARAFAFATSLLWLAIVVFGRFIGYTWFYYT
jgi:hypothetical protein